MRDVASGGALEESKVALLELAEDQLAQTGVPTVVVATVTALDAGASPATATVEACLDYGRVDMRNRDGRSLVDAAAEQRVAMIFHLERAGGRWLVQHRTFPNQASC